MRKSALSLLFIVAISTMFSACARDDSHERDSENSSSLNAATIKIPLPEQAKCIYLIPADNVNGDITKILSAAGGKHLNGSIREGVLNDIVTKDVMCELRAKSELPPIPDEMLTAMGSTPEEMAPVTAAKKCAIVSATGPAGWPPQQELVGRPAAIALATELKTVLVDLYTPIVMTPQNALKSLPVKNESMAFKGWVRVLVSNAETGQWITTRGLSRIGLTDLQALDVPPQFSDPMSFLMVGLAWKITRDYGRNLPAQLPKTLEIPSEIEVTTEDVAEANKIAIKHPAKIKVHLRLDSDKNSDGDFFLTICPPAQDKRSNGEYLHDICHQVFGPSEDKVVKIRRSSDMDKAMATARAKVPQIRKRFLANELPKGANLLVKFPVLKGSEKEYLWAYVTDWHSPEQLQANCSNDCKLDPSYKPGKQLQLKTDSIVDWGIWKNDKFVEGAWTNKVLEK